jgi:hypothetical protein
MAKQWLARARKACLLADYGRCSPTNSGADHVKLAFLLGGGGARHVIVLSFSFPGDGTWIYRQVRNAIAYEAVSESQEQDSQAGPYLQVRVSSPWNAVAAAQPSTLLCLKKEQCFPNELVDIPVINAPMALSNACRRTLTHRSVIRHPPAALVHFAPTKWLQMDGEVTEQEGESMQSMQNVLRKLLRRIWQPGVMKHWHWPLNSRRRDSGAHVEERSCWTSSSRAGVAMWGAGPANEACHPPACTHAWTLPSHWHHILASIDTCAHPTAVAVRASAQGAGG